MNVSSLVNKQAYTDNGAQYNKFSGGKKVGAVLLPGIVFAKDIARGAYKTENLNAAAKTLGGKGKYFAYAAIGYALFAAVGTGLGAIIDAVTNKIRKSKADNAQTQEPQANNAQVQETKE